MTRVAPLFLHILRSNSVKKCSASGIYVIRSGESSDAMAMFEGFFDFLSWIEDQGIEALTCDVCVLNSESNLRRALEFLSAHKEIHLTCTIGYANIADFSIAEYPLPS